MKIHELIIKLQFLIETNGDIPVLIRNDPDANRSYNSVNDVQTIESEIIIRDSNQVIEKNKIAVII